MKQDLIIRHFAKTSRDMRDRGWAEANGGNISLRLNEEQRAATADCQGRFEWQPIYVAEKAAGIYLTCAGAGGVKKVLTDNQLQAIAAKFKCDWDRSLLVSWPS